MASKDYSRVAGIYSGMEKARSTTVKPFVPLEPAPSIPNAPSVGNGDASGLSGGDFDVEGFLKAGPFQWSGEDEGKGSEDTRNLIQKGLDFIMTGSYISNNIVNDMVGSAERGEDFGAYLDNIRTGVEKGVDGGLHGGENARFFQEPYGRIRENLQAEGRERMSRGDEAGAFWANLPTTTFYDFIPAMANSPENENGHTLADEWSNGTMGFVGDVLLDPTTYMTLGVGAVAKGAGKGLMAFSRGEKAVAQAEKAATAVAHATPEITDKAAYIASEVSKARVASGAKGYYTQPVKERFADSAAFKESVAKAEANGLSPAISAFKPFRSHAIKREYARLDAIAKAGTPAVRRTAKNRTEAIIGGAMEELHTWRLARAGRAGAKVARSATKVASKANAKAAKAATKSGSTAAPAVKVSKFDTSRAMGNLTKRLEKLYDSTNGAVPKSFPAHTAPEANRIVKAEAAASGIVLSDAAVKATAIELRQDLFDRIARDRIGDTVEEEATKAVASSAVMGAAVAAPRALEGAERQSATEAEQAVQRATQGQESASPALPPAEGSPVAAAGDNVPEANPIKEEPEAVPLNEDGTPVTVDDVPTPKTVEEDMGQNFPAESELKVVKDKEVSDAIVADPNLETAAVNVAYDNSTMNQLAMYLANVRVPKTIKRDEVTIMRGGTPIQIKTTTAYPQHIIQKAEYLRKTGKYSEKAKVWNDAVKGKQAAESAYQTAVKAFRAKINTPQMEKVFALRELKLTKGGYVLPKDALEKRIALFRMVNESMGNAFPDIAKTVDDIASTKVTAKAASDKLAVTLKPSKIKKDAITPQDYMSLGISRRDAVFLVGLDKNATKSGKNINWSPFSKITDSDGATGDLREIANTIARTPDSDISSAVGATAGKISDLVSESGIPMTNVEVAKYLTDIVRAKKGSALYPAHVALMDSRKGVDGVQSSYIAANTEVIPHFLPLDPDPVIAAQKAAKLLIDDHNMVVSQIHKLPGGDSVMSKMEEILEDVFKRQSMPLKNSERSKRRNASVDQVEGGAKIPENYNTQAVSHGLNNVMRFVQSAFSTRSKKPLNELPFYKELGLTSRITAEEGDAYLMLMTKYFDTSLRTKGIDQVLDNMAPRWDQLAHGNVIWADKKALEATVRLGISDVMAALPQWARYQYILGADGIVDGVKITRNQTNKLLATQVQDIAEILVRSVTRTTDTGEIDMAWARVNAFDAVLGVFNTSKAYGEGAKRLAHASHQIDKKYYSTHMMENILFRVGVNDRAAQKAIIGKVLEQSKNYDKPFDKGMYEDLAEYIGKISNDPDSIATSLKVEVAVLQSLKADKSQQALAMIREVEDLLAIMTTKGPTGVSPVGMLAQANVVNTRLIGATLTEPIRQTAMKRSAELAELANKNAGAFKEGISVKPKDYDGIPTDGDKLLARAEAEEIAKYITPAEAKIAHKTVTRSAAHKANPSKVHQDLEPNMVSSMDSVNMKDPNAVYAMADNVMLESSYNFTASTRRLMPRVFGSFNSRFGTGNTYDVVMAGAHAAAQPLGAFIRAEQALFSSTKITPEAYVQGVKNVQQALKDGSVAGLSEADTAIYKLMDSIFETGAETGGVLSRMGIDLTKNTSHTRLYLKHLKNNFGDDWEQFFPHGEIRGVKKGEEKIVGKDSERWLDWDIKEPSKFVKNYLDVLGKTAGNITLASQFSKMGSNFPRPGYIKIVNAPGKKNGHNHFVDLIDRSLYYPPEALETITMWGKTMDQTSTFGVKWVDNFLTKVFDPTISLLKLSSTTIRPGHHVMSVVGDGWRNFMLTGSPMTKEYGQMQKVLGVMLMREKGSESINRLSRSIDQMTNNTAKFDPNGTAMKVLINGKEQEVSIDELLNHFERTGIKLPRHVGGAYEDVLTADTVAGMNANKGFQDRFSNTLNTVQNAGVTVKGKRVGIESLNAFASHRDTIMRGALAMHYMGERSFRSVEEAIDFAAAKVKKVAPISADLANFEQKVARRAIFYYTWMRGMTPVVLDMLISKPGMSTLGSKMQGNIAMANGLDPESFGQPLSEELQATLPSYLTERVNGPMLKNAAGDPLSFTLANPTIDILNSWGSGVDLNKLSKSPEQITQNLWGMSSPWLKAPFEILTKTKGDSGVPIQSVPQYLGDMVGPLRSYSKMNNQVLEFDGLVPSIETRTEARYRNTDPAIREKAKTDARLQELLNNMFGAQYQNLGGDNLEKTRQFEDKDKLLQQNMQAQRRS